MFIFLPHGISQYSHKCFFQLFADGRVFVKTQVNDFLCFLINGFMISFVRIPNTVRAVCSAEKVIQRNIEVFRIPQERFW